MTFLLSLPKLTYSGLVSPERGATELFFWGDSRWHICMDCTVLRSVLSLLELVLISPALQSVALHLCARLKIPRLDTNVFWMFTAVLCKDTIPFWYQPHACRAISINLGVSPCADISLCLRNALPFLFKWQACAKIFCPEFLCFFTIKIAGTTVT